MILRLKDALGNIYDVPAVRGVGIADAAVAEEDGSYRLILRLTDGRVLTAGNLPSATPVEAHTHGRLTYDGRIGTESGCIVETGVGGSLCAARKIVTGTAAPETVTGLQAGDIYLRYGV